MILIENVRAVDHRGDLGRVNIEIDGNRISHVGNGGRRDDIVIDGSAMIAMPGLINTHTHAAMTLLRSYADDMPLHEWLQNKIWPLEANLTEDDYYIGTKLAILEMLHTGTTTMNDMYFSPTIVARACSEMGFRAFISHSFFDFFDEDTREKNLRDAEENIKKLLDTYGRELIVPTIGPHAPYTVSLDGLRESMALAEKYDIKVHFHLAETEKERKDFHERYGRELISALDDIGFLNSRLIAAHAVWLSEDEVRLLAKRGVSVSHNPVSNMKLAVGSAMPYHYMKKHGLNVTLGTDGAASNNNLNMLESMKFAALLQKYNWDMQTLMPAIEAFEMATVNGARALGLRAGEISEGYLADIVLIDYARPEMTPHHNIISDIVYSFNGPVKYVIIDGTIVMEDGHVRGEEEIMAEAEKAAMTLVERAEENR